MNDSEGAVAYLILESIASRTSQTTRFLALSFFPILPMQRQGRLVTLIAKNFINCDSVSLGEDFSVLGLSIELGGSLLEGDGFDGSLLLEGERFAFVIGFAVFCEGHFGPGLVV